MNYEDNIVFQVNKLNRKITLESNRILVDSGIESGSFFVLASLKENTMSGTMCKKSAELGVDRTTLSRSLEILKSKGYLKDQSILSARKDGYRLTAKGIALVEKYLPRLDSLHESIVQDGSMLALFQILKP